jgi:O-antigen ligase
MSITGLSFNRQKAGATWTKQNVLFFGLLGIGLSVVMAYLAATGLWPVAIGLLAALPAFVLLHRYPFTGLLLWLLLTPFLVATDGGSLRQVYWLIHRLLPLATIGLILLSSMLRIHKRRLPKLGWAELAMAGYLIVTQLSVIYLSDDVLGTTYYVYDRIFVPMCLYLIIRLLNPTEKDLRRLLPVLIFTLVLQSIIGVLSWSAPQLLPSAWLSRVGLRTTGSLRSYSVFSTAVATCGLLILQSALNHELSKRRRWLFFFLFTLSYFMIFLSFSRGSWLAGILVLMGLAILYPRFIWRFGLTMTPTIIIVLSIGLLGSQAEWARQRFYSDQSEEAALSRLPIYYASYRMFEAKPVLGWGYGNFDRFDRLFQERVGDLINPVKDHASHNVYLTIVAEQGTVGLFLFLLPVFWWLGMTVKALPKLPPEGFWSRKLLLIFWFLIGFHFVVNNFSNMRVVYGLGLWWVTLGFIAVVASSASLPADDDHSTWPGGVLAQNSSSFPAARDVNKLEARQ